MLKGIIAALILSATAFAQQRPTIQPPTPDYSRYGSYSRQLALYENTQSRLNELERQRVRNLIRTAREETRVVQPTIQFRTVNRPQLLVVPQRNIGVNAWRQNRVRNQRFNRRLGFGQ